MLSDPVTPLIAVDVGNSRIKLGLFDRAVEIEDVVEPIRILELPAEGWDAERLAAWLPAGPAWAEWWIASVNRPATSHLTDWIVRQGSTPSGHSAPVRLLSAADLPLEVRLEHPERVGMDRLAAATAAARLRSPRRGVLIVDSGTAITVDSVAADGAFLGGAILPGMGLAARALHEFTDLLPLVPVGELSAAPPALGTSTVTAIRSGIYWGAVGGVRELVERLSADIVPTPELFLTGAAGPSLARALGTPARIAPHLVLSGIALARRR